MSELPIRPFEPQDREAVVALHWELNRHEQTVSGDRALDREAAEACLADDEKQMAERGGVALVALIDGAVAGYVCCVLADGGPFLRADLRRQAYVTTLVVGEAFRGRRVATALLGEAERYARGQGVAALGVGVLAGNAGAERLYQGFGFQPHAVEMVKRLR
ncbi:MAG TPA: GNAT family N-acetyltransferase [Bosea sp. (in: a-proteobacteria)]|jgi:phosphinothricin acetyltransferase|uniref:GNAT family N-acetyltransferase n=1 Tax=Bosea sp. (in: a-proteobacteria) TaxID=1871050 RepID=UPI002E14FC10|nr:GNAT family N-acetyltransferase [Bosea sp. (in: a-proteobacteria)]